MGILAYFYKIFSPGPQYEPLPKNGHWLEIGIIHNCLPPNFSLARMGAHLQIMMNWPLLIRWPLCLKRMNVRQQRTSNAFVSTDGLALFVTSQLKLVRTMQIPAKMVGKRVSKNEFDIFKRNQTNIQT
jgi:hypothetical protein